LEPTNDHWHDHRFIQEEVGMSKFRGVLAAVAVLVGSLCSSAAHAAVIVRGTDLLGSPNLVSSVQLSTRSPGLENNTSAAFDLTFGSGLSSNPAAQQAFQNAANRWSALLRDPVTIKVSVDYQPLGSGILGSTSSTTLTGGYTTVRDLVAAGGDSGAACEALLPQLPTAAEWSMRVPSGFGWSGSALLTQANYLALGGSRITGSDGSITFSSGYSWDFNPSNGIDSGTFDFEGCAVHEMGHLLGFVSYVDSVDTLVHNGQTTNAIKPAPLDFFRFDTQDLGTGFNFSTTTRQMAPGGNQSFYYGAGSVTMSTGVYNGDGRQAAHWKDGLGLGIMDPTAAPGEVLALTQNDLTAMDLIGWQVVPEPGTWVILLSAVATAFLWRRLRRK
jgi:hypothetical protein